MIITALLETENESGRAALAGCKSFYRFGQADVFFQLIGRRTERSFHSRVQLALCGGYEL